MTVEKAAPREPAPKFSSGDTCSIEERKVQEACGSTCEEHRKPAIHEQCMEDCTVETFGVSIREECDAVRAEGKAAFQGLVDRGVIDPEREKREREEYERSVENEKKKRLEQEARERAARQRRSATEFFTGARARTREQENVSPRTRAGAEPVASAPAS